MARRIKPERSNQAGRPTAVELERRKARVMEVATELFVSHGYAATSLVDIAKGAGVATRTLYQHFGDKEALFRDVVYAKDSRAIVPVPVLGPDDTLFEALNKTARYCLEFALNQRSVDLMRLMIAESNRFPDLMRKVANATFTRFRGKVTAIFEELEARRLIPADDHAAAAELFVDLILGNAPILTYTNWETDLPGAAYLEKRIEVFIMGKLGPAAARRARTGTGKARRGRTPRP